MDDFSQLSQAVDEISGFELVHDDKSPKALEILFYAVPNLCHINVQTNFGEAFETRRRQVPRTAFESVQTTISSAKRMKSPP